jgi:regulator of protease activity HflC (stomatin/prohibitin superfamily)
MNNDQNQSQVESTVGGFIALGGIVLGGLFLVASIYQSVNIVATGHVGVVSTFGAVSKESLPEGLHFVLPWVQSVHQTSVQIRGYTTPKVSSASHDLQQVHVVVSVQHYIDAALASGAYQAIGDIEQFDSEVVEPALIESIKAVTAQYTAEQLVTKRDEVRTKMAEVVQANINKTLSRRGVHGAMKIDNVAINDIEFSPAFNASVEARVQAANLVTKAENTKAGIITEAEGIKKNKQLAADAEAYKITEASKANAAAIKREIEALKNNPQLLELRLIERWNGKLPEMSGQGQSLNLSDILKGIVGGTK